MKCQCRRIICLADEVPLVYHLLGCPDSNEVKEFEKLKWYQKLFKKDPLDYYLEHLRP